MALRNFLFLAALLLATATSALADDRDYLVWSGVRAAWGTTRGAGVTVATLGTGVNYDLDEFRDRIAREDDGSYGFDSVTGCRDPMDHFDYGVGTQVASVLAGNEFGVAPEARLIPVRIFDENGSGTTETVARGLDYAVGRGAKVIEVGGGPFAFTSTADPLCRAFLRADTAGALLVLPAGNDGVRIGAYPTGCPLRNAVVVAALDGNGDLSSYSNFGFPAVHLAAPAQNIWRISRDGSIRKDGQGTTFSTAYAAGVAALVWSAHPGYRAADVRAALIRGSTARSSLNGKVLANGFLNANLAIRARIGRE